MGARAPKNRPSPPKYRDRGHVDLRAEVYEGILVGLALATLYSLFVLVMAVLRGSTAYEHLGGITTWHAILFYYAAGFVAGGAHGLLAPLRHRYLGRLLNAYLLLLVVYGGGMTAFLPMLSAGDDPADRATLGEIWGFIAVFALVLSPIAVKILDD